MKTASRFLQILALGACFAAQVHGAFSMPGVRRALQTIERSAQPLASSVEFAEISEEA